MVPVLTTFLPREHGFHFVNRFDINFEFDLPLIGKIDLGDIVYGLCGGMCFAALDHYYAGKPVPAYTNEQDIPAAFHNYLMKRQLDSMMLPVVPKVIEWMLRGDDDLGLRMSRYEIPKIRRSLDSGKPVVLALIRVGGVNDPTKNHQVLVRGYDFDPQSKDLVFHLYDPNWPGQEPEIRLNLTKPSQGVQSLESTGEPLRGLFQINYRQEQPE
jgi:hypothetical protein